MDKSKILDQPSTQEISIMRQIQPFTARVCVFVVASIFALRLFAAPPSNTECQASGGCSFPCTSAGGQRQISSAHHNLHSAVRHICQIVHLRVPMEFAGCTTLTRLRTAILRRSKTRITTTTITAPEIKTRDFRRAIRRQSHPVRNGRNSGISLRPICNRHGETR